MKKLFIIFFLISLVRATKFGEGLWINQHLGYTCGDPIVSFRYRPVGVCSEEGDGEYAITFCNETVSYTYSACDSTCDIRRCSAETRNYLGCFQNTVSQSCGKMPSFLAGKQLVLRKDYSHGTNCKFSPYVTHGWIQGQCDPWIGESDIFSCNKTQWERAQYKFCDFQTCHNCESSTMVTGKTGECNDDEMYECTTSEDS
jgi:hypothetical protein